jgi:hypothetical protein
MNESVEAGTREPALPDKVVALDRRLDELRVAHAFGGALALAYYAEPRATIDIDVNVFVAPAKLRELVRELTPLGVRAEADLDRGEREGQCRLWWGRTPIDLFFAYDELHEAMRRATRTVPFGDATLPVLAPEHLLVCKALYDRPKDWIDIEQVLVCEANLDLAEARAWLARTAGAEDPRTARLEQTAAAVLGA